MRPILHGDVSDAARALLAAPSEARERLCRRMIAEADAALLGDIIVFSCIFVYGFRALIITDV